MTLRNSMIEPGQPCVMMSGRASACGERTCRKWMPSPSITVRTCGSVFILVSVARQSYCSRQYRHSSIRYARGTPWDQSSTVSSSGHRVCARRSRRSHSSASGISTRNSVNWSDVAMSSPRDRTLCVSRSCGEQRGFCAKPEREALFRCLPLLHPELRGLNRQLRGESCDPDRGSKKEERAQCEDRDARTQGSQLDADPCEEQRGGEEHDRQHVVVSTLVGVLCLVRECGSLDLETVGLLRRFQAVLRHRKWGLGRLRVPERFRCEPRRERRLKLASEASSVEVGELSVILLSSVNPLNERGDVDLHLSVRERRDAVFRDPVRVRLAVTLRLHAGPLPRLVGGPRGRNRRKGEEHRRNQL